MPFSDIFADLYMLLVRQLRNMVHTTTIIERQAALRDLLSQYPLLTPDELELVVQHSEIRFYEKGSFLLQEGQVAKNCHLVVQGCVRQYVIKDGIEKTTAFYTEGDAVNAFTSATTQTKSTSYLVCVEDCVLTVSDGTHEEEICRLIPRLATIIRQEVERMSGLYQDEITRFLTSNPEERYEHLLEHRPALLQRVPQHQIASYIGIAPESLSRLRKRMASR